jgi:hypothetical protein
VRRLDERHHQGLLPGDKRSAVKVAPHGTVHVAWLETVNKQAVEVVAASHHGGMSFGAPVVAAVVTDDSVCR